jgi:hypothetical protein
LKPTRMSKHRTQKSRQIKTTHCSVHKTKLI